MTRRLFFRCNGGHYFQGSCCPFDGWSMDGLRLIQRRYEELALDCSMDKLIAECENNVELRRRILLIEFGDCEAEFDALSPEHFIYKGEILDSSSLSPNLL